MAARQAAREIYRRLMDAVDPALVDQVEQTLRAMPGVLGVGQVRLRWIGHHLRAECEVVVLRAPALLRRTRSRSTPSMGCFISCRG
jgi:divalent metal cation (Fe/Co/Zn/Cd) transporter